MKIDVWILKYLLANDSKTRGKICAKYFFFAYQQRKVWNCQVMLK